MGENGRATGMFAGGPDPMFVECRSVMAQKYCVFNLTRESFLSLGVSKADTAWSRLRGLLGKRYLNPNDGLWIVPSQGIHTFGMLFPIDAIYLGKEDLVVELVEGLWPFRIGPIRMATASVIELPPRSIRASQTEVGDQFLICEPEEMAEYLRQREAFKKQERLAQEKARSERALRVMERPKAAGES